ncbi:MAG TPA: hypothetical protein VLA12_02625 [Planctomycetaceae bacterium]|nr:hypothetical protein [Planctomycetaceae bacterium]
MNTPFEGIVGESQVGSEETETIDSDRLLCLIADDRPADLHQIVKDIPDGLFREIILIDHHCSDQIIKAAHRLGLEIVSAPSESGRGSLMKFCFNLARRRGVNAFVAFDAGQPRDLESLVPILNLLDQESWDLIIGARTEKLKKSRPPGMSRIDYCTSRFRRFLEPLFLGRQFLDSGSDFIACSSHLLWATRYSEMSDGDVFDWQFMNQILASGYRVGEVPIPVTRFQSATRKNWLQNALSLLQTMAVAIDHQFGRWIGKDRIFFRTRKKLVPVPVLKSKPSMDLHR